MMRVTLVSFLPTFCFEGLALNLFMIIIFEGGRRRMSKANQQTIPSTTLATYSIQNTEKTKVTQVEIYPFPESTLSNSASNSLDSHPLSRGRKLSASTSKTPQKEAVVDTKDESNSRFSTFIPIDPHLQKEQQQQHQQRRGLQYLEEWAYSHNSYDNDHNNNERNQNYSEHNDENKNGRNNENKNDSNEEKSNEQEEEEELTQQLTSESSGGDDTQATTFPNEYNDFSEAEEGSITEAVAGGGINVDDMTFGFVFGMPIN